MLNRFDKPLLLVLSIVNFGAPVGSTIIEVTGKMGGIVTLPCELEVSEITNIVFTSWSENILVCETKECGTGRIFKNGNCDIIMKDLRLSDAGRYDLKVYNKNNLTELQRFIRMYHLYIRGEISAEIGGVLKMDVLLHNADRVEHQTRSSANWMQVWRQNVGVQRNRLTDSVGNLTIKAFMASDAGTYRVLDTEGETWITVTVTESRKQDTDDNHFDEPRKLSANHCFLSAVMLLYLFTLSSALIILIIRHPKDAIKSSPPLVDNT